MIVEQFGKLTNAAETAVSECVHFCFLDNLTHSRTHKESSAQLRNNAVAVLSHGPLSTAIML